MAEQNLAFSKIVSTPTPSAWSQAYSAGRLFAAFSLESQIPPEDENNLNTLGKELISTFESEFFTLENKDQESIKRAIEATASRLGNDIKLSLIVCYFTDDVLYLFAFGSGKAVLKREEKIGTILEGDDSGNVKSASGYVNDGDLLVLQTKQFLKVISPSVLAQSLDNNSPDEAAEDLSPHVHERAEGGAASVILVYNKEHFSQISTPAQTQQALVDDSVGEDGEKEPIDEAEETSEIADEASPSKKEDQKTEEVPTLPAEELSDQFLNSPQTPGFEKDRTRRRFSRGVNFGFINWFGSLSRRRKITVIIALLLAALIIIISGLTLINRDGGSAGNFEEIYQQALTKYEEGQSLKDLNPSLSQESFRGALSILEANIDTFSQGSEEDRQIEELLARVRREITGDGGTITTSEVNASESKLLSLAIENNSASYFSQNEDFVYFITSGGITRVDKGNDEEEELIEKSWKEEGGLGLFGSNVYVLDKKGGVLKFVPTEDEYSETDYFTGEKPSLADAADITIDGSVYILRSNGQINKYTRGKEEDFEITGLTTNLSSPTRITTAEDFDNIYILDRGNSRIVVLDKTGAFVNSYSADIIKNAREFEVDEAGGRILILSGGKVYQIEI